MVHVRKVILYFVCSCLIQCVRLIAQTTGYATKPASAASADPSPSVATCSGKHTAGDMLTCYVQFDHAVEFTGVSLSLSRQTGAGAFGLSESRKLGGRTYAVSGVIPYGQYGTYAATSVAAAVGRSYRTYFLSSPQTIVIEIEKALEESGRGRAGGPPELIGDSTIIVSVSPHPPRLAEVVSVQDVTTGSHRSFFLLRPFLHSFQHSSCGGLHKPGDAIKCRITLSEDIELTGLAIDWDLNELDRVRPYAKMPADQKGLCANIQAGSYGDPSGAVAEFKKIDRRTFEVDGIIPTCMSGHYALNYVFLRQGDGLMQTHYRRKEANLPELAIRLNSARQKMFPATLRVSALPFTEN